MYQQVRGPTREPLCSRTLRVGTLPWHSTMGRTPRQPRGSTNSACYAMNVPAQEEGNQYGK